MVGVLGLGRVRQDPDQRHLERVDEPVPPAIRLTRRFNLWYFQLPIEARQSRRTVSQGVGRGMEPPDEQGMPRVLGLVRDPLGRDDGQPQAEGRSQGGVFHAAGQRRQLDDVALPKRKLLDKPGPLHGVGPVGDLAHVCGDVLVAEIKRDDGQSRLHLPIGLLVILCGFRPDHRERLVTIVTQRRDQVIDILPRGRADLRAQKIHVRVAQFRIGKCQSQPLAGIHGR